MTITPSCTKSLTISIDKYETIGKLSSCIRSEINKNCILQYCGNLGLINAIDVKTIDECNLYNGNTVFVRVLELRRSNNTQGISFPIDNSVSVKENLTGITLSIVKFFFPLDVLSKPQDHDFVENLFAMLPPILELDELARLIIESALRTGIHAQEHRAVLFRIERSHIARQFYLPLLSSEIGDR